MLGEVYSSSYLLLSKTNSICFYFLQHCIFYSITITIEFPCEIVESVLNTMVKLKMMKLMKLF